MLRSEVMYVPVLQILVVSQARAGVAFEQRLVVELLVLELFGRARHHSEVAVARARRELGVARRCVVENFAHTLDYFTKQSFR